MKFLFVYVCVALFPTLLGAALSPAWYQRAAGEVYLQSSKTVTGPGAYSWTDERVVVDPVRADGQPPTLALTFENGPHLTATTFEVAAGGKLTFRNCRLNHVAIMCHPGGEILLENCSMMGVYFPCSSSPNNRVMVPPKVNLENCGLHFSHVESPIAVGLTAKNSCFISTQLDATQRDGANAVSSFMKCVFSECKLHSAEVLLCSTDSWFSHCIYEGEFSADMGAYLPKPILVRVAWSGLSPQVLPRQAGKVFFEPVLNVGDLGRSAGVNLPQVESSGAPGRPLIEVVSLVGIDGTKIVARPLVTSTGSPRSAPNETPAVFTSATGTFKSRQTSVNGLLISQLSSGEEAGQASRMHLTALPALGSAPSTLKFNQTVGKDMEKALNEVTKFSQLRHNGWPAGHAIEIGFDDKYVDKDGPSAAVACALLLEGALTGKKWDPAFAVTGDMNADGSVQPIGGVQAKIRGATKGACKLVGVPAKNEKAVADILVSDGPAPLVGITVFGISTFDEAMLLADAERPAALQNALTDFDNMRTVMLRDPRQIVPLLRTPHAAQRLQALLAAAPNCYSAKYLLMYLQGRTPRYLSIGGSIEAAQSSAQSIVAAIDHDLDSINTLKGDELGGSLFKLRRLRPMLDQRVWPYVDALVIFGDIVRGAVLNPVRSGARYNDLVGRARSASSNAKSAYDKLINDPVVREELGL